MRYVGGKARLTGKPIAAQVAALGRPIVWEPFCGGLNVTRRMADLGIRVIASDVHAPLIALYAAVREGWDPPEIVLEADYRAARNLPPSDPLHVFCGLGCSFGGKWWGGYARDPANPKRLFSREARNGLLRDARRPGVTFRTLDFLAVPARPWPDVAIYCDPPYQGTQGYPAGSFDHAGFWDRVRAWERAGVPVLVSEYRAPEDFAEVWSTEKRLELAGHASGAERSRTERLFRWNSVNRAVTRP